MYYYQTLSERWESRFCHSVSGVLAQLFPTASASIATRCASQATAAVGRARSANVLLTRAEGHFLPYLRCCARRRAAANALSPGGSGAWFWSGVAPRAAGFGLEGRALALCDRSITADFIVRAMRFRPTSTSFTRTRTTSP